MLGRRHIFVDATGVTASWCFTDASPRCFFVIFTASSPFSGTRHKFQLLNLFPGTLSHCWRSNSPLSAQRSSSTPAGGRIYHPPPSGHLPSLLAVKCTPPRPTVILYPCWRSNSSLPPTSGHLPPLPGQWSSSCPAGGQPPLSPPSGHVPFLTVYT